MNQIVSIRSKLINNKVAVSDNSSDNFVDALKNEINRQDDKNDYLKIKKENHGRPAITEMRFK